MCSSWSATSPRPGPPLLPPGCRCCPRPKGPSSCTDVRAFFAVHDGGIMIKALAGGGGRGMRKVHSADQIDDAYRQCAAEAQLGFGRSGAVRRGAPRHRAAHRGADRGAPPGTRRTRWLSAIATAASSGATRKLVEIAPAQGLSDACDETCIRRAARLCASVGLHGLATVEFLVAGEKFVFLEVNPRIQVEHTVTEETTGVDLVAVQLAIAGGASYYQLGLPPGIASDGTEVIGEPAARRGIAIQARVNMETFAPDGSVVPAAGTLTVFSPPTGPGVRVDSYGRPGLVTSPRYDSLLAKVITHVRGRRLPGGGAQGPDRPGRVQHRGHSHEHRTSTRAAVRQSRSNRAR